MADTATAVRSLTAEERKTLAELLKRSGQQATPRIASKVGSTYQALTNLSVPRRGDPDKQCDLVTMGNTVILTDDEAALFLPPNKPVPCIRPVSELNEPLFPVPARVLSGPRRVPADARPDPAGATTVQVVAEVQPPEATPAVLGSENSPGAPAEPPSIPQDALDIEVRR